LNLVVKLKIINPTSLNLISYLSYNWVELNLVVKLKIINPTSLNLIRLIKELIKLDITLFSKQVLSLSKTLNLLYN